MLFTQEYSNIRPVSFVTAVSSPVVYNAAHSASSHTHFGTAAGRNKGYLSGKITILCDVIFQKRWHVYKFWLTVFRTWRAGMFMMSSCQISHFALSLFCTGKPKGKQHFAKQLLFFKSPVRIDLTKNETSTKCYKQSPIFTWSLKMPQTILRIFYWCFSWFPSVPEKNSRLLS